MGGGNTLSESLLFNLVKETTDHGPVNSWDRAPYHLRSISFPMCFRKNLLKGLTFTIVLTAI
jgi:hypothetical protein